MKTQGKHGKQSFLLAPTRLALILLVVQTKALCQDYKPGDPITFGSAHKSLFQPKANNAPLMVPQAAAPASDAGNTTGVVPNNFLNTRSIPWRTGDPVTFGAAHKPYSPDDNKPPQTSNSTPAAMPATNIQSTPVAPVAQSLTPVGVPARAAPIAVPAYAPASDGPQDLQARPGSLPSATLGQPANISQPSAQPYAQTAAGHKQKQKQKPPKQVANQVDTNQSSAAGSGSTASGNGNVFTHFWHWVFGGGNR
ncbi:MAG TPA: hypothetical protein V6C97_28235 [Oculatellaceae cyanobacterium]